MIEKLYTAQATATGGRDGHVRSSDGVLDIDVRIPKEMGGAGGPYTNPEQLFAAGYAACFDSALNFTIHRGKIQTGTTRVTADVSIGPNGQGSYGLAVILEVNIPDVTQAQAEDLAAKAHQVCPYSSATRGNVDVTLKVTTAA